MLTTVINLSTGEKQQYLNIPPEEAVIFAHLNSTGRRNTWEYPQLYEQNKNKLVNTQRTVAMGDWCAMKKEKR